MQHWGLYPNAHPQNTGYTDNVQSWSRNPCNRGCLVQSIHSMVLATTLNPQPNEKQLGLGLPIDKRL